MINGGGYDASENTQENVTKHMERVSNGESSIEHYTYSFYVRKVVFDYSESIFYVLNPTSS
jgi:hypothetical protein